MQASNAVGIGGGNACWMRREAQTRQSDWCSIALKKNESSEEESHYGDYGCPQVGSAFFGHAERATGGSRRLRDIAPLSPQYLDPARRRGDRRALCHVVGAGQGSDSR